MYKSRFKAWRLDKNNKSSEVREILRLRAMRSSLGKRSTFVLRGRSDGYADIERYVKRKGLTTVSKEHWSTRDDMIRDLICITPPSTPPPSNASASSRNLEPFLLCFQAFLENSLQSGYWKREKATMGFTNVHAPGYPMSALNDFFLSIERGIQRHRWDHFTQAYSLWRKAFSQLRSFVRRRGPSQLICFTELIASLAEYKYEVAALLLRYLSSLRNLEGTHADTRCSMRLGLSRLEAKHVKEVVTITQMCSWKSASTSLRKLSSYQTLRLF